MRPSHVNMDIGLVQFSRRFAARKRTGLPAPSHARRRNSSIQRRHQRARELDGPTPISPPHVKYADLLRPVVLANPSAAAEVSSGVLSLSDLRFQIWRLVTDAAPNTY